MNVLIIGLGSIAKKHIAALKEIDSTVSITALRSNKQAEQYEDVHNVFSLAELPKTTFNFAIISSPTANHKRDIEQLLALNIPLFIEKPLYHKLDLIALIEHVNNQKIKTYVACNLRFLACIAFVKDYLNKNKQLKINEVNAYCGSYLPDWRPNSDYKKSYSSSAEKGGGVHLDLIHELDYLYWFFDSPKAVDRTLQSNSSLEIDAIDYAHYNLTYPDFTALVTLNYFRKDAKRSLEIVFDAHTLTVNLLTNEVLINNELVFKSEQKPIETYKEQLAHFINNMSNPSFNDINEAYEVLKICINK